MVETSHSAGWWPQLYEPFRSLGERIADWVAPRSEASAAQNCYEISMELPGVKAEDVEVSLYDGSLTVKGKKESQREEKGRTYFFSEREYGAFQRSFRLPADAHGEDVSADFKDGVLVLKVPKAGQAPETSKRIAIRTD